MLDKWEAATEIRRWLKEKQSNLMQKFLEQAKKSVLKMIKDGVALEMDKVIEVAEDERIEDTDDSQLTEDQNQFIEDIAFKKETAEIEKVVSDVIEKARFLLQMKVPDEFKQAKKEEEAKEVRRQLSS